MRVHRQRRAFRDTTSELSSDALDAVHGGADWPEISIPRPPSVSFGPNGQHDAADWADFRAAQYLVKHPEADGVRYETERGSGPLVQGAYSRESLSSDVDAGRFSMNGDPEVKARLDAATARADDLYMEGIHEHDRLRDPATADPNDEGIGFFDSVARSDKAYAEVAALRKEYDATRELAMPEGTSAPATNDGDETSPPAQGGDASAETSGATRDEAPDAGGGSNLGDAEEASTSAVTEE